MSPKKSSCRLEVNFRKRNTLRLVPCEGRSELVSRKTFFYTQGKQRFCLALKQRLAARNNSWKQSSIHIFFSAKTLVIFVELLPHCLSFRIVSRPTFVASLNKMENVCRTCLRVPTNLTPLYTDSTLISKIETIASIQIDQSAEYPSNICQECVDNVNLLYNFRKVIINSDKELKECQAAYERIKNKPPEKIPEPIVEDIKFEESETVLEHSLDSYVDSSQTDEPETDIKESVKKAIAVINMVKCNICDKTFPSRLKLYCHRRTKHVNPGVCNVCGMVVRSDNLKRHIQSHFSQPVSCKECGKVFKNPESLRGHMLIHKGVTYTCEHCGRVSKVKSEFKRHLRTHTDPEVGKVMCTLCGKRVRDLRKHMHSHTGERPYLCAFCSKGFTSTYSLKVHTRQHTNEKPYICEYCPMAFPQKVSLVTHIKSKHKS